MCGLPPVIERANSIPSVSEKTTARGWLRKVALSLLARITSAWRVTSQNGSNSSCCSGGGAIRTTGASARSRSNRSSCASQSA